MKSFTGRLFSVVFGLFLVSNLIPIEVKASNPSNDKKQLVAKNKDKTQAADFARVPVSFEENKGQSDASVKFLSRNSGYTLFLTAAEAVYQLQNSNCAAQIGKNKNLFKRIKSRIFKSKPCSIETLKMKFLGANKDAEVGGENLLPMKTNYFIGSDETRWLRDVSSFQSVRYRQIYAGIDAVFRGIEEQNLEYDFHIAPSADPNLIKLEFTGAAKLKINRSGELVLKYKDGEIRHRQPIAYQIINGEKKLISVRFALLERNLVGFDLGEYDRNIELTIDPIVYATYLGGFNQDAASDVALNSYENMYVVSVVKSNDFLHTEPSSQRFQTDIAVTKFKQSFLGSGSTVLYNTYFGGSNSDDAFAIDVDANGNAFIAGGTYSSDFTMKNARQTVSGTNGGNNSEGFVTKLNASGVVEYSTYHGDPAVIDGVNSVAVDSAGNAYVSGTTSGSGFPLMNAYQSTVLGPADAFLSKLSPTGQLLYSTLFGGATSSGNWNTGNDVAVDNQGNAYLTGETNSTQLPATSGAYLTSGLGFVAKFDTTKTGSQSLIYSTYIPGIGQAIDNDAEGNAYVASYYNGSATRDKIIKLNTSGTAALYAFTINDTSFFLNDIAVDRNGNAYFIQAFYLREHTRVTKLTNNGSLFGSITIQYALEARGIAVGADGHAYVVGTTVSTKFPTTFDAYQPQNRGNAGYYSTPAQGYLAKVLILPEKNPLIFVPGTMGSELYRKEALGSFVEKYWARWGTGLLYHPYLTLDNQSSYFLGENAFEARDVLRRVTYEGNQSILIPLQVPITIAAGYLLPTVYEDLLTTVANKGQYELTAQQKPTLRNPDGSCDSSQKSSNPSEKPNLFVFPYDFRKSNVVSAGKLKEFIQCVQQFYPGKKVDILAHSQGGLVSRRYILDGVRNGEAQKVDKLITIASPWLGAPEALYKLETGGDYLPDGFNSLTGVRDQLGFSLLLIQPPLIKFLSEFFPSVHELLPTRDYQVLSSAPSLRELGDMNGNGVPNEAYRFEQTIDFLNRDFARSKPGNNGASFHDCTTSPTACGQDDWRNDQSGVKYHHIVAAKFGETTTSSVTVEEIKSCTTSSGREGITACRKSRIFRPVKGKGDGTVPRISAGRGYVNQSNPGLNFPSATVEYLESLDHNMNDNYEHNGVTKNCKAWNLVLTWLGTPSQTCQANVTSQGGNSELPEQNLSQTSTTTNPEAYYIKLLGVPEVGVIDEAGNKLLKENGFVVNTLKGLDEYKVIGEDAVFLTIFPTQNHYVDFQVGNNPIMLEAVKGVGNKRPDLAVRFNDLSLPAGVKAQLKLTPEAVVSLRYDSDGDGSFETTVNPTAVLNGTQANDTEPPTVNINIARQGNTATATITAQDAESGVSKIWYSLDGQAFEQYSSPVSIPYSSNHVKIEAFADDNAANRSGVVTRTVYSNVSVTGTVAYGITPADQTAKFIPGVTLTAAGSSPVSAVTDAAGAYLLNNLTPNANYTVTPSKTGNIKGISPFDATMVLRHIAANGQGPDALNANQKIAADTNGDTYISPFDATLILRYVAANAQSLNTAQVGNWKFDPNARNYPLFSGMLLNENYLGYLIGDVNGSWALDFAAVSSAPQIQISLPQNAAAVKDSNVFIPISFSKSDSNVTVRSYSFHATFDPLVLQPHGIATSGTLSEGCSLATNRTTSGKIGVSASCPISAASGTLINLYFKVVGEANTSTGATLLTFLTTSEDNPTPWFEDTNNNPIFTGLTNGQFTVMPPAAANSDDSILNEKSKDSSEGSAVSAKAFVSESTQQQQPGAEGGIQISLPQNAAVTQGSVVTIPVTLTNSGGTQLSAYSFDVQFNPAFLQAVEIIDTSGTLSSNCFVEANTIIPGRINIAGSCGNSISASAGILVKLRFTVVGQANNAASEARALRFWQTPVFEDHRGNRIEVSRTNGSIR